MAKKDQLRKLRAGTVINLTAKAQESNLGTARRHVKILGAYIKRRYAKWRRRQEKLDIENAPTKASYKGWAD